MIGTTGILGTKRKTDLLSLVNTHQAETRGIVWHQGHGLLLTASCCHSNCYLRADWISPPEIAPHSIES